MTAAALAGTGKTLLIVEDEVLAAIAIRDELTDAGYKVMDLTDRYLEAVSAAQQCRPDLALVNIQLQGRDHGIALARELKVLDVPVLFISGQTSRARSAATVAIASMPKPYSPRDMVLAVNFLLRCIPRPAGLEVFSENGTAMPDAA